MAGDRKHLSSIRLSETVPTVCGTSLFPLRNRFFCGPTGSIFSRELAAPAPLPSFTIFAIRARLPTLYCSARRAHEAARDAAAEKKAACERDEGGAPQHRSREEGGKQGARPGQPMRSSKHVPWTRRGSDSGANSDQTSRFSSWKSRCSSKPSPHTYPTMTLVFSSIEPLDLTFLDGSE